MDPLRMELSRLLRQAQNQSTSNKAMNDIYAFQKRNPDYNMDNVLGEQSKYITLFVKRKLEMMAWNEGKVQFRWLKIQTLDASFTISKMIFFNHSK